MQTYLFFLLSLIALTFASDVVDLTGADIDAAIAENNFLLLELFAPWCGHCKQLAPQYELAATAVKDDGIVLAKIDATEDAAAGQKFGVKGYPTLIWFKNGERKEYKGPRDAAGIEAWVRKNTQPTVRTVSSADLAALIEESEAVVVGYFGADHDHSAHFATVAEADAMADVTFASVSDDDSGKVVVHRKFDEDVEFSGDWEDVTELATFIAAEAFPYFAEATSSWQRLQSTRPVIFLMCLDINNAEDFAVGEALAKEFKADFATTYAGKELLPRLESFGLKEADGVPNGVVISNTHGFKYPFPKGEKEWNAENVREWLEGIKSGDVKPYFKSEAIPEENDGPVTVLVGDNFKDVVFAEGKNVLVEFYAPWCGHCKSLAPIYEELGAAYADDDSVVIAKMDSTANDNPVVQVQGFPTLYFFPAGNDEGVKYSSGRDLDSFKAFIEANRVGAAQPAADAADAEGHDEL